MKHLNLELDEETYQRLKIKFKGDEKTMRDFVVKVLTDELVKTFADKDKADSDKNIKGLEDYLKLGKSGSRSYGTKGQGW